MRPLLVDADPAEHRRQLDRALAGLDFMVAVDFYINETTRHAHLILPPTAALEHDHYDLIFHALAIRNTAKYSPALFNPAPDTRHEWEIFLDLATRLGARGLPGRLRGLVTRRALDILGPAAILDAGLRVGPYGSRWNVLGGGLSLRKLKRNPHGVDLGPLEPSLPDRLHTKNRRIQLTPPVLVGDLDRLERRFFAPDAPATDPDHLALIGRRQLRSNNSWMHNSERLVKGPARCTLLIHPEDALRRGLVDGALARVQTRVGSVDIPVEVSDAIMPGVVSIPHGWGHDRPGVRLGVAQAHAGVSLNDLTDDQALDALCGVAAFSGVPAAVTAVHAVEGVVAPV